MDAQVNERVTVKPDGQKSKEATPSPNLISVHVRDLLNVRRLQGRLSVRQTAALLNCGEHDIPVLVRRGLLIPLGNPPPNAQKYFAPVEVLELAGDAQKMGQICDVLYRHWQVKNAAKTKGTPARTMPSNGNGTRSKRLR